MLQLITGPFHPHLESVLAHDIQREKSADPFAPLVVVVPSDPLRRRVQWLLSVEHGLALLDVHVVTFHQLALLLMEEGISECPPPTPFTLRPRFFFRELLHTILISQEILNPGWAEFADMPGAWAALWSTFKDLKDAGVHPTVDMDPIIDALGPEREGIPTRDRAGVRRVFSLYMAVRNSMQRLQVGDFDDLAVSVRDLVGHSALLQRQRRILYFGFYDLTQVQLDLFHAVARAYPTTLYFPLVKGHAAYRYAERFFERYIQGVAQEVDASPALPEEVPPNSLTRVLPQTRIMTVSGHQDEVTVVAKEILRLVEERGLDFHHIGVVGRSLAGYEDILQRIFDQHRIPFVSTLTRSLVGFPFIRTIIQLLELPLKGFERDTVLDLLGSPFFRPPVLAGAEPISGDVICPNLWRKAAHRLGIMKGVDAWRRLEAHQEHGLPLHEEEDPHNGRLISPTIIQWLWHTISSLQFSLHALPDGGGWSDYVEATKDLIDQYLSPICEAGEGGGLEEGIREEMVEKLFSGLEHFKALDVLGGAVSFQEFFEGFCRMVEESEVPIRNQKCQGVQVLDAMAARGLRFQVLFVVGLNDGVFPRHIREDAFLRDRLRRVLEEDLGFKIQEQLAGYDEEKLLFRLLCESAQSELIVLTRRTDDVGRALIPSSYLEDVRSEQGGLSDMVVPRRLTSKFEKSLVYLPAYLRPQELALKHVLNRSIPSRLLKDGYSAGPVALRALQAIPGLESLLPRLGRRDGMTGHLPEYWAALKERGLSPTSMEEYAKCPFRYFAGKVLGLDPWPHADPVDPVGPIELGTMAHTMLREFFRALERLGFFGPADRTGVSSDGLLEDLGKEVFDNFERTHAVGYPLVWELHQERLLSFLQKVVQEDLHELDQGGWIPSRFEEGLTGMLTVKLAKGVEEVPIMGRIDRIDWNPSRRAYRVVDYKFKNSKHQNSLEKNLVLAAVRGHRFQPPLYVILAQHVGDLCGERGEGGSTLCDGVWFYYVAPHWGEGKGQSLVTNKFPGDAWVSRLRPQLDRTIRQVMGGIREGRFFVFPGDYCASCDFRLVCRRTHQPTLARARADDAKVGGHHTMRKTRLDEPMKPQRKAKAGKDSTEQRVL